ncbi:MAG: hypothetical protein LBV57_03455 [Candidatus Symbiothrix sp.]|jgi:hypothetical protein|nr:hypothetical protein [Candidatus Symbiothrix sp.]
MTTTKQDWLPANHEALYDKANQTVSYLETSGVRVRLGFGDDTPQGEWFVNVFDVAYSAFITAYTAWKNPAQRTPVKMATLTDAENAFKPVYRQFYTGFLKQSPLVTDADLVAMGLPERSSGGHTPAPVPLTSPEAEVRLPEPAVVEIHFRDEGKEYRAKPAGVHGAEIAWAILDTPPENWSQLTNSSFDTKTPFRLAFEGGQRGKKLYFALRWENTRGAKGPWGNILDAIIP